MTPKEKAAELVEKFKPLCGGYWGGKINKAFAKQCAIIAVDEIIKIEKHHIHDLWVEYWHEVRTEIENLLALYLALSMDRR